MFSSDNKRPNVRALMTECHTMINNRVVIMGKGGVGKSAIIAQFMNGKFSTKYKPTVEDNYFGTIQLGGKSLFGCGIVYYIFACPTYENGKISIR